MERFPQIQKILAANLGAPPASILPESKTSDLPGWDSLRHLLIIMDIEQAFGFKFALEEIGDLDSVEKLLRAVEKRAAS